MDSKLLRGSLDTIVLKLLSDHSEMYGYEISQKVKSMTEGDIVLTEGALYPALHRLEGKGLVTTEVRNIGNRMRKYYRLTENGNQALSSELEKMKDFIKSISIIINPKLA